MRTLSFTKGHGTMNDFVIVLDRHATLPLSEADVRALCNRRTGIGGDGVLRVVKASAIDDWDGDPELWFMDYRNSDGSIAEMCGNGLRVFGRYLMEENLVEPGVVEVGTRAGLRWVRPTSDGSLLTGMGSVTLGQGPVTVTTAQGQWQATTVDVGNPHAVCVVDSLDELNALDLSTEPTWSPAQAFPHGTNVEFIARLDDRHVAMRVHERGSGETLSCGTGTVAAAAAWAHRQGLGDGEVTVDVPGGRLVISLDNGEAQLRGPAVLVAHGEVQLPDAL